MSGHKRSRAVHAINTFTNENVYVLEDGQELVSSAPSCLRRSALVPTSEDYSIEKFQKEAQDLNDEVAASLTRGEYLEARCIRLKPEYDAQTELISRLEGQLRAQKTQFSRWTSGLLADLRHHDAVVQQLNTKRRKLLVAGSKLAVGADDATQSALRDMGCVIPERGVDWSDSAYPSFTAGCQLSNCSALPKYTLAFRLDRIAWPRYMERKCEMVDSTPNIAAGVPLREPRFARIVQCMSEAFCVYRFLVVDRETFGRRALVLDGLLHEGKAALWPARDVALYECESSMPRAVVEFEVGESLFPEGAEGACSVRDMANRIASEKLCALGVQLDGFIGQQIAFPLAWTGYASGETLTLLPFQALAEEGEEFLTHEQDCLVRGSLLGFRAVYSTELDSIQALVCTPLGELLYWPLGGPDACANAIKCAQTHDASFCDECSCGCGLAHLLQQRGARRAGDPSNWRSDRPLRKNLLVAQVPLMSQNGGEYLFREHTEPHPKRDSVSPERPKKRRKLSEQDRLSLLYNDVELQPIANDGTVFVPEERQDRSCSLCNMKGTNSKLHESPNHGKLQPLTQAELQRWYHASKDEFRKKLFLRINKSKQ